MTVIADQAAPAWIPIVLLMIPIVIMAVLLRSSFRWHRRRRAGRRAWTARRNADATDLGSAASISDPSAYTSDALLKALAIAPENHGPTADGLPWDEGWFATMLGLKSKMSDSVSVLEPHVLWGARDRGQVFIRLGPDEKIEHDSGVITNRHFRNITVLRVAAPAFQVRAEHGSLLMSDDGPADVRGLVQSLRPDFVTWSDVRIAGGPEGIVAARTGFEPVQNTWVYDLWLCERIAGVLQLPPLEAAPIVPGWKVPYGLGKAFTPRRL